MISLIVGLGAAFAVYSGYLKLGAILLLLSAILDFFNGSLAREINRETRFGALFDSVADRLVEISIIIALAFYSEELLIPGLLSISAILFSSYVSKHAQAVGSKNGGGLIERNEKLLFLIAALVFVDHATTILYILAPLAFFTGLQRFFKSYRELEEN